MSTVAFKRNGLGYEIRFRYDPDLVTLIKGTIPGFGRKFDPDTKAWSADSDWARVFAGELRSRGHTVVGLEEPKRPQLPPPPPPAPETNWALTLLSRVSPELRTPLYRSIAKHLHTDLGGDGQLMRELNDARSELDQKNGAAS